MRWTDQPQLREPALVAAFEGWNDGAESATDALRWLRRSLGATEFAVLDVEEYLDYQAARPHVVLVDGVVRRVEWPGYQFLAAPVPDGERDLVLLLGPEPNLRWRAFCSDVFDVARAMRATGIVTLGALLADVPHTRPLHVTGSSTDESAAARIGLERSRYEGPTGIVGVLHATARDEGFEASSLWAPVPHYVSAPPNPKATLVLLDHLAGLLGLPLRTDPLLVAAQAWEQSVGTVVAADDDIASYVARLEAGYDAGLDGDEDDETADDEALPSGDALAADFERYLREQGDD